MQNVVAPLYPIVCTISTGSPRTKVQASSVTANTILMTYQITEALYTGP